MDTVVAEPVSQQQPTSTTSMEKELEAEVQVEQVTPLLEKGVLEREVTPELAQQEDVTLPDSTTPDFAVGKVVVKEDGVSTGAAVNGNVISDRVVGKVEDLSQNRVSSSPDTSTVPVTSEPIKQAKPSPVKNENPNNKPAAAPTNVVKVEAKPVKGKKKEDKSIDHILRALSSLNTSEEKLAALCKKYTDLHEEHRILQVSFKQSQRQIMMTIREKDQIQTEHTKAVMAKSKLESLCRELQKHNKVIKEESVARAREEDEKRREISNRFQHTIGEIQNQMTDNHDRNVKLREDNTELAGKLSKFVEQYELREQQVEKIVKHRELEKQLGEAKLAQANAILKELEERSSKEREFLLLQAAEAQKKSHVLEAQLTMYKERYEEFQSTINRSNEMFGKFKTEMDKMGKRIKKLEKEGALWKSKWEGSNRALLRMAEDKGTYDKAKSILLLKVSKLESLCRALQAELHGKKPPTPPAPVNNNEVASKNEVGKATTPPKMPETTSTDSPVKEDSNKGEASPLAPNATTVKEEATPAPTEKSQSDEAPVKSPEATVEEAPSSAVSSPKEESSAESKDECPSLHNESISSEPVVPSPVSIETVSVESETSKESTQSVPIESPAKSMPCTDLENVTSPTGEDKSKLCTEIENVTSPTGEDKSKGEVTPESPSVNVSEEKKEGDDITALD